MAGFLHFLLATRKYIAVAGLAVILGFAAAALMAPLLYSWESITLIRLDRALAVPSWALPLGADELGRDMTGRIVWGARISLLVAALAVSISLVFGLAIGALAGFYQNWASSAVMRAMDAVISFPRILVAIILIAVLGPGVFSLALAIGLSSVPVFARLFRAASLSLRRREFVLASQSLGATDARLLLRHIVPNTASLMVVQGSISLAEAILIASGLSFLGLGPQPPTPEWGAMIAQARAHMVSTPHVVYVPGLALFLVVLALNVVGDGLRDFTDPRASRTSTL